MKTLATFAVAMLLGLGSSLAQAAAHAPEQVPGLAARLLTEPNQTDADLARLRRRLGDHGFFELAIEVNQRLYSPLPKGGPVMGCQVAPAQQRLDARLRFAANTDENAWRTKLAVVDSARRRLAAVREAVSDGTNRPGFATAAWFAHEAAESRDARVKELERRAAQDQFYRMALAAPWASDSWGAGVEDPTVRQHLFELAAADGCDIDLSNTAWLKADLAAHGWYRISVFGRAADSAAFLIVQHADHDAAFQRTVVEQLEALVPLHETKPENYALLYDRVAVGAGRPQRYGSQGSCTAPGVWEPKAVEQPEKLDERRASVGLQPEAQYKAMFVGLCRQAPSLSLLRSSGSGSGTPSSAPPAGR